MMPNLFATCAIGLLGGLIAALVMSLYQNVTKSLFRQGKLVAEPATVWAANSVSETVEGRPVPKKERQIAGEVVHYVTGAVFGIAYAPLAFYWPAAAIGFGTVFGIVMMLAFDDLLTPLFGWGPWPWATRLSTHAYSLTAHIVFGAVLECVRRLGSSMIV